MKKNGLLWVVFIITMFMLSAVALSSCTYPSERRANVIIQPRVMKLFVATVATVDSIGIKSETTFYCKAFDRYDADRVFNDSITLVKQNLYDTYTIREIALINNR